MDKVLAIFRRDVRRIAHNPVALIVTLGVCIIPSLYAWFNIIANWDPYKNTSDVAIAVVNEDAGAEAGSLGHFNAGDMIQERLEQNDQLGWRFVDEAEGMDGVQAGRYYATIVIPEDFTARLAGVLDGEVDKAHIRYYANERSNAIAPKVTDTGASTIEAEVDSEFVKTVGSVVTQRVAEVAGDAEDGIVGGSSQVSGDLRSVEDLLGGLADDLDGSQSTIDAARGTLAGTRDALADVQGTTQSVSSSLSQALGGLGEARSSARTLAGALGDSLRGGAGTISSVSSQTNYDLGRMAGDIGAAQARLDDAIARIRSANGTVQTLQATLTSTRTSVLEISAPDAQTRQVRDELTGQLSQEISFLVDLSDRQLAALDELQRLSDGLKDGTQSVQGLSGSVNDAIQGGTTGLTGVLDTFEDDTLPGISSALDSFSDVGNQLQGGLDAMPAMLRQVDATLGQLDATLAQAQSALRDTSGLVRQGADDLGGLADDVDAIASAELVQRIGDLTGLDPDGLGDYLGSPVNMVAKDIFPVANYGSGVAPFYTNLALWVGGFVLVAIYKLEVDKEGIGDYKPWQGYFGRWLLLNALGIVQALVCCVGDLVLGIQCVSPGAFVLAGLVESFVYVNIIYALSIAFKHIGKALGVILVVVQIPGSSGTYPIQMMPGFFQALNPWLPFTYGINAMREAIAGFYDGYFAYNVFMLLLFVVPSLVVGVVLRRHLLNINALFDRKLGETELMITERVGMPEVHFRLSTIVKALTNSREYHEAFTERVANFELRYPIYVRRGFLALLWVPLVLMVLMFVLPYRMVTITLWIISLVVTCTYLIVVEYFHARVAEKMGLADKSEEELYGLLGNSLKEELFAFAPLEKMKLDKDSPLGRLDLFGRGGRQGTGRTRTGTDVGGRTEVLPRDQHDTDGKGGDER